MRIENLLFYIGLIPNSVPELNLEAYLEPKHRSVRAMLRPSADAPLNGRQKRGRAPVDFLSRLGVTRDGDDFRDLEDARIKFGSFFGLMIEPKAGADFRTHGLGIGWVE